MKLERAIELVSGVIRAWPDNLPNDHREAIELGGEALKAWKEIRREWRRPSSMLLPGETKE